MAKTEKQAETSAKTVATTAKSSGKTEKPAKAVKSVKSAVKLPELKEFLKAGVQFGHEAKRWDPKMKGYIFSKKNNIHIIDLSKTLPYLELAGDFIAAKAQEGPILFLGTKRQAAEIMREAAIEAGVHFVTNRWAGGLLTNFEQIKSSINKLTDLEKQFEEGVTGRTKYEISLMKKDWERLSRLYGGIKTLNGKPAAIFVVDPGFESGAVRECNYLDIPVVSMVDTNSDPSMIDYPIPANDDAIGSIKLVVNYIKDRIKEVNSTHKVNHVFKDFAKSEVSIKKDLQTQDEGKAKEGLVASVTEQARRKQPVAQQTPEPKSKSKTEKQTKTTSKQAAKAAETQASGGILGKFQEQKEEQVKQKPR